MAFCLMKPEPSANFWNALVREYNPDHTDKTDKFSMVDVEPVMPTKIPVTLAQVKAEPKLSELTLVRQAQLSVLPVTTQHWRILYKIAKVKS